MLLTTNTVTETNRDLLRILLTGFYLSSAKARDLHKAYEAYASNYPDRHEFHLKQAWDKISPAQSMGPLPQAQQDKVEAHAIRHHQMMTKDVKERFFAHLIEFVQDIKTAPLRSSNTLSKKFSFSNLPNSEDFSTLRNAIRSNFSELMKELRQEQVRELILSDFTPAKVSFNVVPIRPDIEVVDPMVTELPPVEQPSLATETELKLG